jgi:hypothetical protein
LYAARDRFLLVVVLPICGRLTDGETTQHARDVRAGS